MNKNYVICLLIFVINYSAYSNVDSLKQAVKNLPDSTLVLEISKFASQISTNRPSEAAKLLLDYIQVAENLSHKENKARYYFNLAFAYDYMDSLNFALVNYYKSLEILKSYDAKVGINHCLNNIGVIFRKKYNIIGALKAYRESYDFSKQQNLVKGQISTAINLTNIYLDLKDYDKMKEALDKTLELSLQYKDSSHLGLIYSNFGNYYYEKGEYIKGLQSIEKGWQVLKNSKDLAAKGANRNLLAKYYIKMKKFDKATREIENTQLFADSINSQSLRNQILFNRAMYYKELGNYDSSLFYASKAILWVKEVSDIPKLKIAYQELATTSSLNGNFELAYLYMDSLNLLIDSLQNNMFFDEIARASLSLEGEYNSDLVVRYREEVQTTKEENELIKKYVKEIELYLYFIAILLVGLIIVISLLIYNSIKLKNSNKELQSSRENLEALNATKDKFFSIIAHDLRGPISGIKNILDHMNNYGDDFSEAEKNEVISDIAKASNVLLDLLENLLTWSRSQRGLIQTEKLSFNAFEATKLTVENLSILANQKNIKIENNIEKEFFIDNDINLFNTIVRNIISNSIKFTPIGGLIQVSAFEGNEKFIFTIKDNGVGMDAVTLANLFRIDFKSTNLGTSGEKGTGLGLIICREFALKMGGDIQVQSKIGAGTEVSLILPS